jgi:hypothetical protein
VWACDVRTADVVLDEDSHLEALRRAFGEASTTLLVASAFLTNAAVERIKPDVIAALGRGVHVDLLWGYEAGESSRAGVESLKKLAYEARRDGHKGALRFNTSASGSHAKLVLYDTESGFVGVVGSYNWLSAQRSSGRNVSIVLRHNGIVSELCGCAAGLWASAESEVLSSAADRWRTTAADLERIATTAGEDPEQGGAHTVRLVFDREHEALVREWSASAQNRLYVCSHQLGPAAGTRLVRVDETRAQDVSVVYGMTEMDEAMVARMTASVRSANGSVTKVAGMHAKVLLSDVSVCVSSYNFLSADPFGKATGAREIGVALDNPPVAEAIARYVTAMTR